MAVKKWGVRLRHAVALAVLLTVTAAAGCADGTGGKPVKTSGDNVIQLEYWTPFSGGDNRFMTGMVDRFNREHKNIRVVQTNSRLDDYYSRLRTAILAGNAPDVAIIHATNLPLFVQNGYVEQLDEPARAAGLDLNAFNPNILTTSVYNGRLFAVPLDTHALVMFYNKRYLEMAGVLDRDGKPVIGEGTGGFTAFLQRIKEAVPPTVAPMAQPSTRIDSVWLWWSLYNQIEGGGAFYSPDGKRSAIDNPQALRALNYVNELYRTKLIPPDINDAFKLFYDGDAAVLITGMWGTGAFENAPDLELGVVPFPVLFDRPAVWGDTHTLAIPTKISMTEEKRAAVLTFARWMVEHGEMWAEAGHVPSLTEVAESEAFLRQKNRSDYAATANYVAYWPKHVQQWTIVEVLIRQFERMIYGQQSPEQALEKASNLIDAELKS